MDEKSVNLLKEIFPHTDEFTRKGLLWPYLKELKDKNPQKRSEAASALGIISDICTIDTLIEGLGDEDSFVKETVYRVLCDFDHKWASPMMFFSSLRYNPVIRKEILDILEVRGWQPPVNFEEFSNREKGNEQNNVTISSSNQIIVSNSRTFKKEIVSIQKNINSISISWSSTQPGESICLNLNTTTSSPFDNPDFQNWHKTVLVDEGKNNCYPPKKIFNLLEKKGWKPINIGHLVMSWLVGEKWQEVEALGTEAIQSLSIFITAENDVYRVAAINCITKIKDSRVIDQLLIASNHSNPMIANDAKNGLVSFSAPEWVDHFLLKLQKVEILNCASIVEILGNIGDAKALKSLLHLKYHYTWNNISPNSDDKKTIYYSTRKILDKAIEKVKMNSIGGDEDTFCGKCLCRYQLKKYKTGLFSSYKYHICPSCHSNLNKENGIKSIQLTLDQDLEDAFLRKGETLIVNWFKFNQLCDYDEIVIQSANDFDVEELVLKLVNDKNEKRRNRMKQVPVYVDPKAKLSMGKINLLKDYFQFEA